MAMAPNDKEQTGRNVIELGKSIFLNVPTKKL